jgi:hypothetical protein
MRGGETPEERAAREAREAAERAANGQQPQNLSVLGSLNTGVSTLANGVSDLVTSPGETFENVTDKTKEVITSGVGIAEDTLGDLQGKATVVLDDTVAATKQQASNILGLGSNEENQDPTKVEGGQVKPWYKFWGGKRHMTGGQGLGLTYYATPVNGLKVAEPTYMEYYTGGRRKRSTRKRKCCKRHRHCRKTCNKRHKHCKK